MTSCDSAGEELINRKSST